MNLLITLSSPYDFWILLGWGLFCVVTIYLNLIWHGRNFMFYVNLFAYSFSLMGLILIVSHYARN